MTTVPLHIKVNGQYYSLTYLYNSLIDFEKSGAWNQSILIRPLDLDRQCYGIYRPSEVPVGTLENEDLSSYPETTRDIVTVILGTFDNIDEKESLNWYKALEPSKLADAIEAINWRQSVLLVGAELLSNLILAHGLPNANHRTSIAMLEYYLETFEPLPRDPAASEEGDWSNWANKFIRDSKKYTSLRRNTDLFRHLAERGATTVERKQGVEISLDRHSVTGDDPWSYYEEQHLIHCRRFVKRCLNMANAAERARWKDDGKSAFAARL